MLIRRPSLLSGVLTGVDFSITLCCVPSVCAFRTIVDSERFNWSISTYLVSTKAGECGLTRGTCFVAGRLELAAVAVMPWCAMSAAIFCLLFSIFFLANAHDQLDIPGSLGSYSAPLRYVVPRCLWASFFLVGRYLFCSVCLLRLVFTISRAARDQF